MFTLACLSYSDILPTFAKGFQEPMQLDRPYKVLECSLASSIQIFSASKYVAIVFQEYVAAVVTASKLCCCRFFYNSPKESGLLKLIGPQSHTALCKMQASRTTQCDQHFYQVCTYITEAHEEIVCRHHLDRYGDLYADWDTANLNEASTVKTPADHM